MSGPIDEVSPKHRQGLVSWHHIALVFVLAGAAALNTVNLAQNGYANTFYSAGVRSMLDSWHNFLYASFDPGGLITVDKPPLGLWVQVASAKLLGFSVHSLLLPEAFIGVLAVGAIYWVMARPFGRTAALGAAAALAVFPSFVAVSRENGVDPLLLLLMILACGAALRAVEGGRWRWLIASAVLVGLAFNVKTLAAWLIVPGIALAYLICAPEKLPGRLLKLAVWGTVMLAMSFAWIAFVELTPASKRPFVGSSTNNTELGLTFEYNGFGRVEGELGGPGRIPLGSGALPVGPVLHRTASGRVQSTGGIHLVHQTVTRKPSLYLPDGRRRDPISFESSVGPLRLFETGLGEQGGWMIPFALGALLALALAWLLAVRRGGSDRAAANRRDPRLAALLVLGSWFLVEAVVLSTSKGIVHPYYASGLAPGVAAMVGAGAVAFSTNRISRLLLLPLAVAGTVAVQLVLLGEEHYMHWFAPVLIGACLLAVLLFCAHRVLRPWAMALLLIALLAAPATFSTTTWLAPVYGTFPAAGPRQAVGDGGYGISHGTLRLTRYLARYARTHHPGTRWAILTVASDTAAPFILMGVNAGSLAGYSGDDPALSGPGLARYVRRGEARYVVLGGSYSSRGGNGATIAVKRACLEIPQNAWGSHSYSPYSLTLFDCAHRERALASA